MLEVGHDLRYLGERRCLRQVATVAVADVVGKDRIERLGKAHRRCLQRDTDTTYLAHQLIDVPMVLRNAFNKLIKSLNEISNLGFDERRKWGASADDVHPRNKDRNLMTKGS